MSRSLRAGVLAAAAALIVLALALTAGPAAARGCGYSRSLGTTYVTGIHASRTSCRAARSVVRAFNKCRHQHGKAGHCKHRVLGYRCREGSRLHGIGQYDANVKCRRGARRVSFHYTQNT